MPELPETETLARDLNASLVGRVIAGVEVHHADVLRAIGPRVDHAKARRPDRAARLAPRQGGGDRNWGQDRAEIGVDPDLRVVVVPRFTGGLLIRGARGA